MSFFDQLEKYNDAIALVTADGGVSYRELLEKADKIAECIPKRSLAFCVCANEAEAVCGYVGMLRRGVVPVMVNGSINAELYEQLYRVYRPQFVWRPAGFQGQGEAVFRLNGYELIRTEHEAAPSMADDLALLLTTSGSTGSPKLVRQTYGNIDANTESIATYLKIRREDRAITTLPMSYTYGLSIIQSHLYAGAAVIMTEKNFLQKEFWEVFKKAEATTFGGVPYTYEMLKRLRFLRMELPSLRYITQAGGKLGRELHLEYAEGMREKGGDFIVMYGATEATARMAYVPAEAAVEKAGSIGIAIPGGKFELLDENGNAIETPDTVGELVYYGANVTMGYAESREDLSRGDERGGRLETGDMATRDEDGYYYIVGRKKRFLKIYGNRINLMEVERLLAEGGFEAACVGEDDHMRIYTTGEETEDLHDYIANMTKINRAAFSVFHIDEIPRNDSGKVLYSELK